MDDKGESPMAKELSPCLIAERSLIKKYRRELWNPFIAAVKRYELVSPGDRIAVCLSGGKDSMVLAKLMQELLRHTEQPFELRFLAMDPGYNAANRSLLEENARLLEVPLTVFESNIFQVTTSVDRNPCYLCARMRRGFLYSKAQELGCNKIALGHHLSDVIETTLLGLFYGAQLQSMPPKLHSANFPGMELIRPLYCIREEDIQAWQRYNHLRFLQCACRFTEERDASGDGVGASKRQEMKALLRELRRDNPNIEKSIFAALHDVQIDTFPGCKFRGRRYALTDWYDGPAGEGTGPGLEEAAAPAEAASREPEGPSS
jgi:tRNA 2-thiocytidine biosynthesis protein TtcA